MAELFGETEDGKYKDTACKHIVKISQMKTVDASNSDNNNDPTSGSGILNGFVQVMSFDFEHPSDLLYSKQSVSGAFTPSSSMDLYANDEMLVVGGRGWARFGSPLSYWEEYTYLMGFDIEQGIATPSTVGLVPGYMLNQFSMDIHKGNLRVATTINENWGYLDEDEEDWGQISPSKSQVIVLEKVGQEFKEMGRVSDLGLDERIYSVRFLGDRGFVVTFRNIDPLYALNMTDPTNPFNAG
eukprot:740004_1